MTTEDQAKAKLIEAARYALRIVDVGPNMEPWAKDVADRLREALADNGVVVEPHVPREVKPKRRR